MSRLADSYNPRIVITGIGVVSPIGIGKDSFWQGLKEGRSGIRPVTLFDTSGTRSKMAGEISDFSPDEILGSKGLRNLDRATKLALCAAKLALEDSQFQITEENADDVGVVLGSTMGSVGSISEFDKEYLRGGLRAVNPGLFPNTVINSPASQVSIRFKIRGFNSTISSGFTSTLDAFEYAKNFLSLGRCRAVLVGGAEELSEQYFKGMYRVGFLAGARTDREELCSPFDKRRNGAVIGEGSAIFLMETLESAKKRSAKIYSFLDSVSSSFDGAACFRYNLRATGLKNAISKSFRECGIKPDQIQFISCAANSTIHGDFAETKAIESFYPGKPIIVNAVKSMTGESFSASGAIQVAASLLSMQEQCVFPTINYREKDNRCSLDCVPNQSRPLKINRLMVLNNSPMGRSAAAILSKEGVAK